jgi:hypothetical protein
MMTETLYMLCSPNLLYSPHNSSEESETVHYVFKNNAKGNSFEMLMIIMFQ